MYKSIANYMVIIVFTFYMILILYEITFKRLQPSTHL